MYCTVRTCAWARPARTTTWLSLAWRLLEGLGRGRNLLFEEELVFDTVKNPFSTTQNLSLILPSSDWTFFPVKDRIMKGYMESPVPDHGLAPPPTAPDGAVQRLETRDWFKDSGAQRLARGSNVSYEEYARRARERHALPATFDDDRVQIELDLDRILPSLQAFLLGGNAEEEQSEEQNEATVKSAEYAALVAKLRRVLMAYSVVGGASC
jgi:hypothetical protein